MPFAALEERVASLARLDAPVVVAVNGVAAGGGMSLAIAGDVVVAAASASFTMAYTAAGLSPDGGSTWILPRLVAEGAKIGFVFARRGIVPEACSSWFLPRIVGISRAMEWVATGRVFDAQEALEGGLARSVHAPDELLGAANALTREIAENSAPVSVAVARRLLWTMLGADHPMEAHKADSRAMFARGQSADAREGVTSFLEKRPAAFGDRVSDGLPELYPDRVEPVFS